MRWHTSKLRRLAVLPAAGLAAVAFAAPAHAEDQPPSPVPPAADYIDRLLTVAVDEPDAAVVSDVLPSPVESATSPTTTAAATVDVEPSGISESPANEETSLWVLAERVRSSRTASNPQAAVISPSEPARPVARTPAAKTAVRRASPAHAEGQYQLPRAQYQGGSDAARRIEAAAPSLRRLETAQASERDSSTAPIRIASAAPNDVWNCSEKRDHGSLICPVDADWKFSWNCRWIPECTLDAPTSESLPPGTEPDDDAGFDAPECGRAAGSGAQYQRPGEQYQSEPEDPDSDESNDEDAIDPVDDEPTSEPCDEDDADELPAVPSPDVQPPSGSGFGSATQPVQPSTATASPAGSQGLTNVQPSAPPPDAVSGGKRPAAVTHTPSRSDRSESALRPAAPAQRQRSGAALAVATYVERPSRPKVHQQSKSRPQPSPPTSRRSAAGPRVGVLASPEPASARGVAFGEGFWLVLFAMLLSAAALLGLSVAGPVARREWTLLARIGSRVRSKGLSRAGTVGAGKIEDRTAERSSGIRYRD